MDPLDAFYQQLDSEALLKKHGPELVDKAREILSKDADAKVTGLILTADGQVVPAGLVTAVVPRPNVEPLLTARVGTGPWQEPSWQRQQVLPVVVSTRDGFRFGFFGLGTTEDRSQGAEPGE